MKNVSRNKFLLCFRPVVDMDLMLESSKAVVVDDRSQNHQALTYVGVKNKEDMKPSSTTKSSVSDAKNSIMIRRPGKKTFSKVIKAVVFETILAKRVRDRKGFDQEESYSSSKHNFPLSCSHDKLLDTSFDESINKVLAGKGIQDTISKSNSISSISSCSSSSCSTPNSTQKAKIQQLKNNCSTYSNHQEGEMRPKQEGINRGSSSNSAMFLLLISLAVTIFWGKFCAIFFTSIWLYFLHHQQPTGVIETWKPLKEAQKISQEITKRRSY